MTQRPWTHLVDEPAARHLVAVRLAPSSPSASSSPGAWSKIATSAPAISALAAAIPSAADRSSVTTCLLRFQAR